MGKVRETLYELLVVILKSEASTSKSDTTQALSGNCQGGAFLIFLFRLRTLNNHDFQGQN